MMTTKNMGMMVFAVAMMVLIAGRAGAEMPDMAAQIAAAKTAADHEAIAAEYSKEAAAALEQASRHDKMGASYTGAMKEKLHFEDHCRALANNYRAQAKEFEALAAAHRAHAKTLGK